MASTQIFVFTVSLQPFNRFSSNFHQKSRNIYPNLQESARISIRWKTKWCPKWRPPRYLCLLYLFNRSADFHQIFAKNFEIYFPTYRNLLEFQNDGKQNGVQNGVHLDIVFTVSLQPFNRFPSNFHQKSQNIFPNLLESARISIWQKTKWRTKWRPPKYLFLLYLFNRSTDFHQIFTQNLEIYSQTYRNLLEFQYGRKQNGVQNGVHLDICV